MDSNIRSHRPVYYFALVTLGVGALGFTPYVLASYGLFPSSLGMAFLLIGLTSPTVGALAAASLEHGRKGVRLVLAQFTRKGFSSVWLLVAVGLPFVLALCAIGLLKASGGTYNIQLVTLTGVLPAFAFNLSFNIWEEIGWRGFALPTLQKSHSALASSLLVGAIWWVWHWGLFAVRDSAMTNFYHSFAFFAPSIILYSIILTWVYNSSNGSLLTVWLYHASANTAGSIIFYDSSTWDSVFPFFLLVQIIVAVALLVIFKPVSLSRREKATFKTRVSVTE